MRHFVNLALVPFFLTLAVTGLMRFLLPFSLVTTRVHIMSGFAVLILIGLHLVSRTSYFKSILLSPGKGNERGYRNHLSQKTLLSILGLWIFLLAVSLWGLPPAAQIIDASYESRHRATIFRSDPQTVYKPVKEGMHLKRVTDTDASLLIQLDWSASYIDSYGQNNNPFSNSRPQMAIWAESDTGTLIETLFLSEKSAFSETFEWAGYPHRRVDILPIWRNRFTLTTGIAPDGGQATFFSGATPEHSFSVHNYLKTNSKPFYLYVELNAPNDSNNYFNSDYVPDQPGYTKPGIGQPSVLYGAYIEPTKEKQYLLLDLVGHGGGNSSDGNIHYDLGPITTAKKLIEKILVRVEVIDSEEEEPQSDS
ncbi:hypothetical protein SAMN05443144_1392 [Fodinibius roseus]|uniref:DUF4405 domain-containing protein n=1 Tax=Fodinibius roseus TaxID=1194090 RepID=A0A1M5L8F9_9BACT|nr:DUF4405 domain-containing protein [Fodinibius roseus]SHG61301.1 hypothetical protein SAMN05443144_1392 [Fodinibius roseus]